MNKKQKVAGWIVLTAFIYATVISLSGRKFREMFICWISLGVVYVALFFLLKDYKKPN